MLLWGGVAWLVAFALALRVGSVSDTSEELFWVIVRELRLPRALLASALGAGLALSGAVLQALFANPLCEPYILGISSGAALGSVLGIGLGLPLAVAGFTGSAFLGAASFVGALLFLSRRLGGTAHGGHALDGGTGLLLVGVMLGFLGSSLVALWMALADPSGVHAAMGWLLGDLSRARLSGAVFSAALVLGFVFVLLAHARALDTLLLGEETAQALGTSVHKMRRRLVWLVSLLVAVCVSAGGMIGFVGLVIPHLARMAVGATHRRMLPVCAIWGAAALTASDILARVIVAPAELPVGVVTALAGAPLFFWVFARESRRSGSGAA